MLKGMSVVEAHMLLPQHVHGPLFRMCTDTVGNLRAQLGVRNSSTVMGG